MPPPPNPYEILGVKPDASDAEVRAAYRRLVQLHHPDHNGGSAEATRRFEQIQAAYTRITELRQLAPHVEQAESRPTDRDVDSRLADLEREVREAHAARERARRAAREAATRTQQRPTDEELGYVTTDDSLSKLLADVRTELAERLAKERKHSAAKGVGDLIDELASKLGGGEREPPRGRR
jgi:curved DNA-binding protein CbpA